MALTRPRAAQIYDIDYKQATRVVTVANITLAGGAPSQVDGVNLSLKDRVLVTGQSTASQNGIYYVTTLGTGANGTWTRSLDTDATGELLSGTIVMVTEGVIYADTQWKLTTDDPITIGVTGLTFVQNYSANSIASGNSNVVILTNANVLISSTGTANVIDVFGTGIKITGTESVTGNITGANIFTGGVVSATGNVTGNYFLGNVFFANGITASKVYNGNSEVNVTASGGNVNVSIGGTSNVAVFTTAGLLVTGITSVSGNITGSNILTGGLISATGNITGNYLLGNVACASGIYASRIFNGNSEANIGTDGGNANISIGGISNVVVVTTTGILVTGVVSATANVTGGNVLTAGVMSSTGNATAGNVLTAGLITATGNATAGNILTAGLISATGNITANNFIGNGNALTGINSFSTVAVTGQSNIVASGLNSAVTFAAGNNISITTGANTVTIAYSASGSGSIFATGGDMGLISQPVTASEDLGNLALADTSYDLGTLFVTSTFNQIDMTGFTANVNTGNLNAVGLANIVGNINGGNITTAGLISATGNITVGNVNVGGNIVDTGALSIITGANGNISLTPNGTGIVTTSGALSATGNITSANTSVTGNTTITYAPATTLGAGITVSAANTQGGTGYSDFLKATNTSGGATNPNKTFRLNSTGSIEIINSAYSATLLSLTDAGALSIPGPIFISGAQAVNGPAFRAYISVNQTITSGSQQKVTFGAETFDTNSNFATSRFTPTVAGYYQFNATVRIGGGSSTGECMIILYKNGAEYARGNNESGTEQGASFYSMQVSDIAYANGTGDYFEVYIQQTSGASKDTQSGAAISYFSGCMMRGA